MKDEITFTESEVDLILQANRVYGNIIEGVRNYHRYVDDAWYSPIETVFSLMCEWCTIVIDEFNNNKDRLYSVESNDKLNSKCSTLLSNACLEIIEIIDDVSLFPSKRKTVSIHPDNIGRFDMVVGTYRKMLEFLKDNSNYLESICHLIKGRIDRVEEDYYKFKKLLDCEY